MKPATIPMPSPAYTERKLMHIPFSSIVCEYTEFFVFFKGNNTKKKKNNYIYYIFERNKYKKYIHIYKNTLKLCQYQILV